MTQHWTDIKNADVVMILGSNTAENHPMGFKWIQKAMDNGATLINVDPRFCRSSAKADIYAPMRSGTDIAFIGGMIKYAIDNNLYNEKYVKECTNALLKVNSSFETCAEGTLGVFSGFTGGTYDATLDATLDSTYSKTTWDYDVPLTPTVATSLDDPDCVFQKIKEHFANYTIENVCAITGTPEPLYQEICETYCSTYPDDKSATILYAMGTTQHTVGTQNVRSYAILQLLLGNMGVAGGGINALRGQDNVQGATDQSVLNHILPGYLKVPTPAQTTLTLYKDANYNSAHKVQPTVSYTVRGVTGVNPPSLHWWQNGTKYITSLLKAWWPTIDHNTSYGYLSRKTADYSILTMFDEMYKGNITGAYFDGENPAVSDPDSNHVRTALGNLTWLVCVDPYETETAAFWKRPGVDPATIATTVYLLPSAVALEKYGSRSNSGRWVQWHWMGGSPPGQARADMDILVDLGTRLKGLIADAPVANLKWPCLNYTGETDDALAELIAKEMHGYNINAATGVPGTLVTNFVGLKDNGSTACGNWLHSGMFAPALDTFESPNQGAIWPAGGVGNRAKRRYSQDVCHLGPANDPQYATNQIGLYSYWSWCWPINRRIVYNRASVYQSDKSATVLAGDPLASNKYVIRWDGAKWVGDMWDGGSGPGTAMPFIMTKDGYGHVFGGWTVAEGPFPWHYEPAESPIDYPSWLGAYRMNPMVHNYGASYATHGDTLYNIFATSYRLTEHWHTGAMSRNLPRLNELQPEPFVEMSEELAADTTAIPSGPIANGDLVTINSARGSITIRACVTKRFKPFRLNGTTVHQVGIIWHWGYMGLSTGDSGNILTPFIGDANTRIQESKAFRVNIVKV
jgi:formate dehydrogenase major subunit